MFSIYKFFNITEKTGLSNNIHDIPWDVSTHPFNFNMHKTNRW